MACLPSNSCATDGQRRKSTSQLRPLQGWRRSRMPMTRDQGEVPSKPMQRLTRRKRCKELFRAFASPRASRSCKRLRNDPQTLILACGPRRPRNGPDRAPSVRGRLRDRLRRSRPKYARESRARSCAAACRRPANAVVEVIVRARVRADRVREVAAPHEIGVRHHVAQPHATGSRTMPK